MRTHLTEKSPLSSYFARCLRCLSPVVIADCPNTSETAFEKVLPTLVNSKTITLTVADNAKSEYRKCVTKIVNERKFDFLNFDKEILTKKLYLWYQGFD